MKYVSSYNCLGIYLSISLCVSIFATNAYADIWGDAADYTRGKVGHVEGFIDDPVGTTQREYRRANPHYETNKFRLKARQESGGWVLAWSDDITETDAANGAIAAGVSIYSGGSSFALWVQRLVRRTLRSTMQSAGRRFPEYIQNQAESLARQVISDALKAKSPRNAIKHFDTVDFKVGAIRYTGGNYLGNRLVGPRTWGMKIYIGFRIR